jgi:hypothetical protein
MHNNICAYTQWLSGASNVIADALSRYGHMDPALLTKRLATSYPNQVPASFQIRPLPPQIASEALSRLERMTAQTPLPQQPTPRMDFIGKDGTIMSNSSSSFTLPIHSFAESTNETSSSFSVDLQPQFGTDISPHDAVLEWLQGHQTLPPQSMWHRPSGCPSSTKTKH